MEGESTLSEAEGPRDRYKSLVLGLGLAVFVWVVIAWRSGEPAGENRRWAILALTTFVACLGPLTWYELRMRNPITRGSGRWLLAETIAGGAIAFAVRSGAWDIQAIVFGFMCACMVAGAIEGLRTMRARRTRSTLAGRQ